MNNTHNMSQHGLPPLPLEINYMHWGFSYEMWPRRNDIAFCPKGVLSGPPNKVAIASPDAWPHVKRPDTVKVAFLDAWKMREQFLAIRTEQDALRVLNETGFLYQLSRPRRGERPFLTLFSDLVLCQEMIRDALVSPVLAHSRNEKFPQEWKKGLLNNLPVDLREADGRYIARIDAPDAVFAMMATVKIDKAWGAEYRYCQREDCDREPVFRRKTQHDQKFCSYECAHLVAVRKNRILKTQKATARAKRSRGKRGL